MSTRLTGPGTRTRSPWKSATFWTRGLTSCTAASCRGELPRNPKLPERMGARTGRAFLAEANLTEAAEFIRVVGCNALNGRKVKVTQAAQAVRNARLVVQAAAG